MKKLWRIEDENVTAWKWKCEHGSWPVSTDTKLGRPRVSAENLLKLVSYPSYKFRSETNPAPKMDPNP